VTQHDPANARYHRQMLLPEIGAQGQSRLAAARVAIIGCGALGCALADTLVRAGVGASGGVHLVDRDTVELTNLQRQTLFTEADAEQGLPKADAARRRLYSVNSRVRTHAHVADLTARNGERLLSPVLEPGDGAAVLLDATDNFQTRFLLNDLSVKHEVPLIYGGVIGTRGMQCTFIPFGDGATPCLRCLFDAPPPPGSAPTCDTAGVLSTVVHTVAAAQATEAIKLLIGRRDLVAPGMLDLGPWSNPPVHRRLDTGRPRDDCRACALRRFDFLDSSAGEDAALCGQDAIQLAAPAQTQLNLDSALRRLAPHGDFALMGTLLLRGTFSAERSEGKPLALTLFPDGRAIIRGTTDPTRARTLYARYIGS
jgi:molybdopterin/thiamine biosynthesis adenylyltransferase